MSAYEILCRADSPEWLTMRQTGIGASEMPILMGLAPWSSPLKVFAGKVKPVKEKQEPEYFEIAHAMEETIRKLFAKRTGLETFEWQECLRSTAYPWMTATPDFYILENGIRIPVEGKFLGVEHEKDWDAGVPPYYRVQVLQQDIVTEAPYGYIAVLAGFGGRAKFFWGKVERDTELEAKIIETGTEFWRRVVENDPPYPVGAESDAEALKELYPDGTGEIVSLPGIAVDWDEERQSLLGEIKAKETRADELKQLIQAQIGGGVAGELPNGVRYTLTRSEVAAAVIQRKAYTMFKLSRKAPK